MWIDFDTVEVSIKNLRRAGIRTFLTLIGVIIGIAAIVSLLSIGQGLSVAVEQQFEQLGSNTIFVIPGAASIGSGSSSFGLSPEITPSDLSRIESTRGVESAIPIYSRSAVFEFNNQKISVSIMAVEAGKADLFQNTGFMDVQEGSMITRNDSSGILIGNSVAFDTFDRDLSIRKKVLLNGIEYTVRGILKKQTSSFGGGPSTGNSIYMSLDAFNRLDPTAVITPSIVFVKTLTKEDVVDTTAKIKADLERKYGEKSFTVYSSDQILEQINQILSLITLFLAGVGGISLIVGGIGIMNAMITSVMERTKEIGVMKALGASNNKILMIFVLESAFIGGIGGLIGIIVGYGLASVIAIVGSATGFNLVAAFSLEITIGALLFSMLIGMISGILPAIRAAKLDPVAALRYE